VYIAGW